MPTDQRHTTKELNMRSWYYSVYMLVTYVSIFLIWRYFPSRGSFVIGGLLAVGMLTVGMIGAYRRRYFVNRVDLWLHAYVLVDLLVEGLAWEGLQWIYPERVVGSHWLTIWVNRIHDNSNFLGCTLVLSVLIGGYRAYALYGISLPRSLPAAPGPGPIDRSQIEPRSD